MRLTRLGFAPVVLACVASAAFAQQQTTPGSAPAASQSAPAQTPSAASPPAPLPMPDPKQSQKEADAIARGQAKAAERAQKDKEKADAKAKKDEEKQKKEAEKDASYLKLQDNEIVASTFDENGNPVKLAPCARKDKVCQQKRKELLKQKKIGLNVKNGTLTVDGWTGKARLNYDVKNFQYAYFSLPGYGTIIASPYHFPNSTEVKDGLDGKTLTVNTSDSHTVQLGSDDNIAGKQKHAIYYAVDKGYMQPGRFPSMGYGYVNKAPYQWPGALPLTEDQVRRMAKAPALPKGMEAREMTLPCQVVAAGDKPKQIKVNGVLVTPPTCKAGETPGPPATAERAPDGSGAASNGVAEDHSKH